MTKITNIEKNDINLSFKIIKDTQNDNQTEKQKTSKSNRNAKISEIL